MGIAYFKTGNKSQSAVILNELSSRIIKSSVGSPNYFTAAVYSAMGDKDKALQSAANCIYRIMKWIWSG